MDAQHMQHFYISMPRKKSGQLPVALPNNNQDIQSATDRRTLDLPERLCRRHEIWILFAFFSYLAVCSISRHNHINTLAPSTDLGFKWTDITPSDKLHWKECYSGFYCARLSVPLDYSQPDGEKAAVALIKLASKYSSNDAEYRGPIMFNPGGPGDSGVAHLLGRAEQFRTIVGDEFDLIGFDPRGVGFTTPYLNIFQTRQEGALLQLREKSVNETASSLGVLLSIANVVGDIALSRSKKLASHVSTPTVVRDMLSIVKAHGRDKLQYWGFSYGTVLGATFAAMFPENVGRLIIDAVVDSENYYDALWDNNLFDTDAVLSWYYNDCVKAGPQACPIYEPTAEKIHRRIINQLERLRMEPVVFFNSTSGMHGVVDYSLVKWQLFLVLFYPGRRGMEFARAFVALESGNAEPIWTASPESARMSLLKCECPAEADTSYDGDFVGVAIRCGDVRRVHDSLDNLKEYFEKLSTQSFFADLFKVRVGCAGWKIEAKERFRGSFVANTSHPLLLIGNTADPVTPLRNAHKMSKGFNGSVVLTQNSPGHGSLSSTSLCTAKVVREYFCSGKLPEKGTVCEVESSTFGDEKQLEIYKETLNAKDEELLEASRALQMNYSVKFM